MYTYTIGLPLLILAAVIDASVMIHLRYQNGQPSLLLILITAWALLTTLDEVLPWAVMGGILADLLSVTPIGSSSLAFVLVALALSSSFGRVGRRNLILPPLAVSLATVIYQAVIWGMLFLTGWSVSPLGALLTWTLPTLVFNVLGMVVVFRVMGAIVEFIRPPNISAF